MRDFGPIQIVIFLVCCAMVAGPGAAQPTSHGEGARLESGLTLLAKQECALAVSFFREALTSIPESADELILLGVAYDCSGDRQALLSLFDDIWNHDLDPQEPTPEIRLVEGALRSGWKVQSLSPEGRYFAALLYARVGRYEAALAELNAVGAPVMESWSYYNLLGTVCLRQERFADAQHAFDNALERSSGHADTFYKLGTVALATSDVSQAILRLKQALGLRPGFPAASAALGIALLQAGEFQAARDALAKSTSVGPEIYLYLGEANERLDDREAAIAAYKTAVAQQPRFFEAELSLGRLLLQAGRAAEAAEPLRLATELQPDRAQAHLYFAMALASTRQTEKATQSAVRARDTGRAERADFHDALGSVFQSIGRTDDARRSFTTAVNLDPNQESYVRHLAASQMAEDESAALATLQAGVAHLPASARLQYLLGLTLLNRGSAPEALVALRKATELEPATADYQQSLGACLATLERDDEAMKQFRQVLALNDQYAPAYLQIGILQLKADAVNEAEQSFKKAMDADAGYAPSYFRLGKIYYDRKEDAQALTLLEKARALDPSWEDTYFLLGMLYKRSGDQEKAAKTLAAFREKKNELQDVRRSTYEKAAFEDPKPETAKR